MSDRTQPGDARPPEPPDDVADGVEDLVARCLTAHADGGADAVDAVLASHAHEASRVRRRLDTLERLGLLASDERDDLPGRIGPHRVLRRLGRGGMGDVFLAQDGATGAPLAIKLARLSWKGATGAGAELRERFAREVRAVASLRHPAIVGVRDTGEHDGRPWYAMDVVAGATLAGVLARLRALALEPAEITVEHVVEALALELDGHPSFPASAERPHLAARTYLGWACDLAAQVARALAHAHERGVVHRDVKPSNILVCADGSALLFDFGLAHVVGETGLTRSGDLAGTPSYVAPEQIEGRVGGVDGRTDVWGLGVTLYETLTLRRPFEAEGAAAVLRAIVEREPKPLRAHLRDAPRDLESVCAAALEKQPSRRYPTALAFARDLERFLSFQPVHARAESPLRRAGRRLRRRPALASALALAALVLLGTPIGLLWANAAIRAQAQRAERAADDARRESGARERVVDQLVDLFRGDRAAVDPEVLDAMVERVLSAAGEDALARASLLEATGRVFHNMGQHARALPLLDRAFALRRHDPEEGAGASVELSLTLSEVHLALGHASTALALAERALAGLSEGPGERPGERPGLALDVRLACARAAHAAGDVDGAARRLDEAAGLAASGGDEAAGVHRARARFARDAGLLAEARTELERAVACASRAWVPDAAALSDLRFELAEALQAAGDPVAAEAERARAHALNAADLRGSADPAPALDLEPPWLAEYEQTFQRAVTALQAGDPLGAVEHFQRCLELRPRAGVVAYNLACGYALAGERAAAWRWLEQAVHWGYGRSSSEREGLRADTDLASLRSDARFAQLLAEVDGAGGTEADASGHSVRPPQAGSGDWLVFLHASGADGHAVAAGPWGAAARALGHGLFAPTASRATSDAPDAGREWFEHASFFARAPWMAEDELLPVLRSFADERSGAAGETWLAGEREGGMVAFDVALRAPGRWRGVLLVDAPLSLAGDERRLAVAAQLGLRVTLTLDPALDVPGWPSSAAYARAVEDWTRAQALGDVLTVRIAATPRDARACEELLRRLP